MPRRRLTLATVVALLGAAPAQGQQPPGVSDPAVPNTAAEYERCKATHRCPRAYSWYEPPLAELSFASNAFPGGPFDDAGLFADFEDWTQGTRGWGSGMEDAAHFRSFDFDLGSPLELGVGAEADLYFNTSSLEVLAVNTTGHTVRRASGELAQTLAGTEAAVFNFEYVHLGAHCRVHTAGERALVLLSRSSMRLATTIEAQPGTLGGFPGGRDTAANNINGPGSASRRVYLFTVQTQGSPIQEVQTVTSSARPGQTLTGSFHLEFRGGITASIPFDASAELFQASLERATKAVGKVHVTRTAEDSQRGATWTITFLTATGNLPQLSVHSTLLEGIDARVEIATLQDGNEISGDFQLEFLGQTTAPIPFNASSALMRERLEQGFAPLVETVAVQRTDPAADREGVAGAFGPCDHGLCADGPGPAKGLAWTLTLTTDAGKVTPFSPTSPLAGQIDPAENLTATVLVAHGENATLSVHDGHRIVDQPQTFTSASRLGAVPVTSPFTLAFGGSGAGHASAGTNKGAAVAAAGLPSHEAALAKAHTAGRTYSSELVADLLGGSGGALGGFSVRDLLAHYPAAGLGGHGGGAIELVAVNDIILEGNATLRVSGGDGANAFWGGGGGSGGSIVVAAGGVLWAHEGARLVANGGAGGSSTALGKHDVRGDGSGGRVAVFAKAVRADGGLDGDRGFLQAEPRGTTRLESELGPAVHLDHSIGAAGTASSLRVQVAERVQLDGIQTPKRSPFARNGPLFRLAPMSAPPSRVSLFFRIGSSSVGAIRDLSTAFVGLHEDASLQVQRETMIGTGVVRGQLRHGSNFPHSPSNIVSPHIEQDAWYKLDIHIDWAANTYLVRLNDVEFVREASFVGADLQAIGLYGFHGSIVWFDEVFVGRDDTAMFRCPGMSQGPPNDPAQPVSEPAPPTYSQHKRAGAIDIDRPVQTDWPERWHGEPPRTTEITRHESHLSERALYHGSKHDLVFFEGGLHQRFRSDVADVEGAAPRSGELHRGMLVQTPALVGRDVSLDALGRSKTIAGKEFAGWSTGNAERAASAGPNATAPGRVFWYSEHDNPSQDDAHLLGGVMACSTIDFKHWRNEGTMLHYANISYDGGVPRLEVNVHGGVDGPGLATAGKLHAVEVPVERIVGEGNWSDAPLKAERPKVIFNEVTNKYVMWAQVHDASNELGVAAVATSDFPGGPFELEDVFLPDGNQTHDQTVIKRDDGTALLVRTYFATVDYILPEPVMQPIWESVKDEEGEVDFGLNYHRANYLLGYDDSDDICIQRLRKEDIPAEISALPLEDRMAVEDWIRNAYMGNGTLSHFVVEEQHEPWRDTTIIGQGDPAVRSRFKYHTRGYNNAWRPSSVPAVKAQNWTFNYQDDNVADNVVHATLPDKLIGPPQVVEQRRAKYVAVSLLTQDYLTTSGAINVVEGYVDSGLDLASWLTDANLLNFDINDEVVPYERYFFPDRCEGGSDDEDWEDCNAALLQPQNSTAPGQMWALGAPFNFKTEYDWSWRYHQYRLEFGDRADAPVNFKDQLVDLFVEGRGASRTTRGRDFRRVYDHNCFRGPNEFPESDPRHVPADALFNHTLSQRYLKTEGADIASTRAHLLNL